ncbi:MULTISPECIES: hypothetical protein [Brevibacterium]|uniref:hypothetical protein n=1 Tax=Brevibacterium TaxID=1696 RepID=UPI000C75F744|nr:MULTISPECIES: hypothetical protein [Brevibacterium]
MPEVTDFTEESLFAIWSAPVVYGDPRAVILAVISEVESSVDFILQEEIEESATGVSMISDYFVRKKLPDYFMTWSGRKELLRDLFRFNGFSNSVGQEFMLIVEIRNALVHGNGSLTELQCKDLKRMLNLKTGLSSKFSIGFSGRRLVLDSRICSEVCEACAKFLIEVDRTVAKQK